MRYDYYSFTLKQYIVLSFEYIIIILLFSYLFYDSIYSLIVMAPFIILFYRIVRKAKCNSRMEELEIEFLKSLQSIAASLSSGYSPENSFIETEKEMEKLYGNNSIIVKELKLINKKVQLGERLEDALNDFATRTGCESIEDFALIFAVGKQSGGSFSKIISSCITLMQGAKETENEIKALIRGKQYEQRIMSIIPLGIIFYFKLSSGNFISVLYHNILGICVMTGCLILYIFSLFISEKICQIVI